MSLSIVHSSAKIDVDALAVTLQRTSDAPHLSHFNSGCHRFYGLSQSNLSAKLLNNLPVSPLLKTPDPAITGSTFSTVSTPSTGSTKTSVTY